MEVWQSYRHFAHFEIFSHCGLVFRWWQQSLVSAIPLIQQVRCSSDLILYRRVHSWMPGSRLLWSPWRMHGLRQWGTPPQGVGYWCSDCRYPFLHTYSPQNLALRYLATLHSDKDTIDHLLFVDKLVRCQRGRIHLSLAEKSGQVLTLKESPPLTPEELMVLYLICPMMVKGMKTFPTSVGYGNMQHLVQVFKEKTGTDFNGSVVYVDGFNQYLFSLKQRSDKPYKRRFRKNIPKF